MELDVVLGRERGKLRSQKSDKARNKLESYLL